MTDLEQHILGKVRDTFGEDQLANAIIYADWTPVSAGEKVQAGDVVIDVSWDAYIAFVDLEPKANWGHACSYLAVRLDGDDVLNVPAHMPPFLKAGTSNYRLLWRGPLAPEWAVAT